MRMLLAILIAVLPSGTLTAQCILANPSFELAGGGGAVFAGWSQFGSVGWIADASHGSRAARVSGPNYGGWDVSAFWQAQDCQPGEQWEITGHVRQSSSNPLTAQCAAIVNVEWRDGGGALIDYDTFSVATPASPTDDYLEFSLLSSPAPAGTASARLLLGVLQSPGAASPEIHYDQVTFFSTSSPTIDAVQWNDFPGGNAYDFGGYRWRVKGPGYYGPGPNLFCDEPDCVWVDAQGRLHITLQLRSGNWWSSEVVLEDALGYGDYVLSTVGALDLLDPAVVLGIFLWEYGPCWDPGYLWWNAFNEVDIEYSRWGNLGNDIGQFVAQPYDYPGNINRFDAMFGIDEEVSHAIRWLPDRVEYRVWRGGPDDESPANLIHSWTYTGPHVPRPEQPRMHLNLWRFSGAPAADQEVVFSDFRFVPERAPTPVPEGLRQPARAAGWLLASAPNPFNPRTSLRFELAHDQVVRLDVYDLAGRRLRELHQGLLSAGEHRIVWDGRDGSGARVASGSYLVQLRGSDYVDSQRVTLLK